MKVNRLVLLAPIVAAVALAGCELSLRAGQACPCAEGWICCTGSNVCVHDQTECAAHSDGGIDEGPQDAVSHDDGSLVPGATVTILAATGLYGINDLAIDETHVYWLLSGMSVPQDHDAQVLRVAKTGGTPEVIVTIPPRAYTFAVDATHAYVATNNQPSGETGSLIRVPKIGGQIETLTAGLAPYSVVVDDAYVYWISRESVSSSQCTISRLPKDGGDAVALVGDLACPTGLAVDATSLFFPDTNHGRVLRAPKTGGEPVELASGFISTDRVSLDETTVYFMACKNDQVVCESGQDIYTVAKTGGSAQLLASAGQGLVAAVPAATHLYIGGEVPSDTAPRQGFIDVMPKAGGELARLAAEDGMQAPWVLAVEHDESALYWADMLTGDIGVVRLR